METVAVFGISGVGKSTLINRFIEKTPDWVHLQAGNLIRAALKDIDHDQLRLEGNEAIIKNQYLMIDAFWKEVNLNAYSKVIFDGHSIIDTSSGILKIPVKVIESLKLSKIIFIRVDAEIIKSRRSLDIDRNRPILTTDELSCHQEIAIKQAKNYSSSLSLPFVVLNNPDYNDFVKAYEGSSGLCD